MTQTTMTSTSNWRWEEADPLTRLVLGVFEKDLRSRIPNWRTKVSKGDVVIAAASVLEVPTETAIQLYERDVLWGVVIHGRYRDELAGTAKQLADFGGSTPSLTGIASQLGDTLSQSDVMNNNPVGISAINSIGLNFRCLVGHALGNMASRPLLEESLQRL